VAKKVIVDYLRIASRSYMFSTAMLPAASAALIEVLKIIDEEPERRKQLISNVEYLREELHRIGFFTFGSQTQIIPILIGKEEDAISFSRKLFERGIFAPAVRWPAVGKGAARIRITVMATHSKEHLIKLIESCSIIAKELSLKLK
jgi:7-keto-8-aminopelargonate synthetase-like enzyme